MPNIKVYDQPSLGIRPSEIGIESTAAAARRGGHFFSQAAGEVAATGHMLGSALSYAGDVAVRYMEHREISTGAANLAALQDGTEREWNETVKQSDPNDPSVAAKYVDEQLNPRLNKFKESFMTERGRAWAEARVDRFREHMFQRTSADMSTLAKEGVAVNFARTVNHLSSTVRQDP